MINNVMKGKGFYISWNPMIGETALVKEGKKDIKIKIKEKTIKLPNRKFYILMGNYTNEYTPLIKKGYKACKKLFDDSLKKGAKISTWSD